MTPKRGQGIHDSTGKWVDHRHVMYSAEDRMYVDMSGRGFTPSRFWAWSGSRRQAANARDVFGIPDSYRVYRDGEEVSRV